MNVDLIIKSKWIAPVDSKETLIIDHAIVINDKKIVALCPHKEAATQSETAGRQELTHEKHSSCIGLDEPLGPGSWGV